MQHTVHNSMEAQCSACEPRVPVQAFWLHVAGVAAPTVCHASVASMPVLPRARGRRIRNPSLQPGRKAPKAVTFRTFPCLPAR